jgi:hypothetical protein
LGWSFWILFLNGNLRRDWSCDPRCAGPVAAAVRGGGEVNEGGGDEIRVRIPNYRGGVASVRLEGVHGRRWFGFLR